MSHEAPAWLAFVVLPIFFFAYVLVFAEEKIHLRKSKPVMIAGGLIWVFIGLAYRLNGGSAEIEEKLKDVLLEYAELLLFLLAAMSFVNTMVERNVFESLRVRLTASRLSVRGVFWVTGVGAFFLSAIADNLTTALVMGTVVCSTLKREPKAIPLSLINIVIAANAGGVFSPFGDVTTLMVWQKNVVRFLEFFNLFLPALANWLIPAVFISLALPRKKTESIQEDVVVKKGGYIVTGMFLGTIATTVSLDHFLHLPPFLGMMLGLGVLNLYGFFLRGYEARIPSQGPLVAFSADTDRRRPALSCKEPFNIFSIFERVEWDTLLYFYGIMLCVGGLGAVGYLNHAAEPLYTDLGPTYANVLIGLLSSIFGNIPLTYAVLTMNPAMDLGQWLLITLTAGVGGSVLSIGSAAGVALMGISNHQYTFMSHLKWAWAIALGYIGSIAVHLVLNQRLFH